jgi:hypothetical protein
VCDPAGDVRELFRVKAENKMLRWECARLAAKVGEGPPPVRSRERRRGHRADINVDAYFQRAVLRADTRLLLSLASIASPLVQVIQAGLNYRFGGPVR